MKNKTTIHKIAELIVIVAILTVLLGKMFWSDYQATWFLVGYGISVTLVMWVVFVVAFVFYRDLAEGVKINRHARRKLLVSCMVAVRNEELNINRCLDSILRQTYNKKEVIVVNDASTDNTLKILQEYEKDKKIILINLSENVGKKKALGIAMAKAKGKVFAHTDSDSVWADDAIEKIMRIFEKYSEVGAVSGHGRALNGDKNLLTKIQDSWMEGQFSIRKAFESVFGAVTCVSGPLAVFRKKAVFNFIPAWEDDKFLGKEFRFATDRTLTGFVLGSRVLGPKIKVKYKDSEFVKNNYFPLRDWQVVYCKSAKSWTIVPDTMGKFIRQQIRWKKSFIRNIFFTGAFYWQRPMAVSLLYYLHIIFVLMGPVVSFRHLIYLPVRGDGWSAILYLAGIIFVGLMFGAAYKLEDKNSHRWIYRPAMSLLSTLVVSWLIFFSALTIRKMTWQRG